MTLAEAGEVFEHWQRSPPAYLMLQTIAAMLGWRPPARPAEGLSALAAMPPPGLAATAAGTGAGMPPAVFDVEEMRARNAARLAQSAGGEPG